MYYSTTLKSVPYSEIPVGRAFKALHQETRKNDFYDTTGKKGTRIVKNDGTYLKIAESHAHDLSTGKDAIFPARMPCRLLAFVPNKALVDRLPDWDILKTLAPIRVKGIGRGEKVFETPINNNTQARKAA